MEQLKDREGKNKITKEQIREVIQTKRYKEDVFEVTLIGEKFWGEIASKATWK